MLQARTPQCGAPPLVHPIPQHTLVMSMVSMVLNGGTFYKPEDDSLGIRHPALGAMEADRRRIGSPHSYERQRATA